MHEVIVSVETLTIISAFAHTAKGIYLT